MNRFLSYCLFFFLIITACREAPRAPTSFVQGSMTLEDRREYSIYDWADTREVVLEISTPNDGAIKLRAMNGEILFHGYLVNGVLLGLTLNLPHEIDAMFLEFGNVTKSIKIEDDQVVYALTGGVMLERE